MGADVQLYTMMVHVILLKAAGENLAEAAVCLLNWPIFKDKNALSTLSSHVDLYHK